MVVTVSVCLPVCQVEFLPYARLLNLMGFKIYATQGTYEFLHSHGLTMNEDELVLLHKPSTGEEPNAKTYIVVGTQPRGSISGSVVCLSVISCVCVGSSCVCVCAGGEDRDGHQCARVDGEPRTHRRLPNQANRHRQGRYVSHTHTHTHNKGHVPSHTHGSFVLCSSSADGHQVGEPAGGFPPPQMAPREQRQDIFRDKVLR